MTTYVQSFSAASSATFQPAATRTSDLVLTSVASNTAAVTTVAVTNLVVATQTPASAAATGVAGTVAWDASYVYVCVATNTWKRVAITTW